jgi:multidrug efflux system outer membrane protein
MQSVQNAFREVKTPGGPTPTGLQLEALGRQVGSLRQYDEIARLRYDEGYTDFLTVLDAERSLFNAELAHTQTRVLFHQARIGLYKAVGGGWPGEVAASAADGAGTKSNSRIRPLRSV